MPILTANINFLASLGITTSEQFSAAFGDMADFTEYCTAIGYSWELGENNDIILITPNGNKVNTYVPTLSGPTSIQFDSASYSISGVEYDPSLQQNFTITDNLGNDVTNDCTITLYPNNTGIIVTGDLIDATAMTAGAYTVTMTATYEGMTATAAINADIAAPAPQSISFGSNTYTITANEGESNPTSFVVEDDLGNDVTNDCTYSFSPNNTGVYVANGAFYTDQMTAGAYTVTVTATYGELTATATLDITIDAPVAEDIYFDSASYSLTGTAGDPSLTQSFTVEDDLGNDVTNDCTITLYPANTGISVSGGLIDATAMSEGLYHITMTATYGELTATSTIDADIAALPITDTPTISYTQGLTAYTITATGNGTVLLYADGVVTQNPCSISRTTTAQTITFTATAQETGKQISATATEVINIPAMEVTPTPVINYDSTTFTVDVTGNGTVLAYVDGVQTQMPHTFTQGASAVTYVVTATAQETGKQISATATENCLVPAVVVKDYMKLSVLNESGNDGDITITIPAAVTSSQATSLSYSKDGSNWTDTTVDNTAQTITIPVVAGDEVYLKGIAKQWSVPDSYNPSYSNLNKATIINSARMKLAVSGNIMSLLYGDDFENQTSFPTNSKYNFGCLFANNSHINDASQLELPATTLTEGCYAHLFHNCTSLTSAPALPATTLTEGCYEGMFKGCTSLTSAPELPATTLAKDCYGRKYVTYGIEAGMFEGCTSLTSAPELPATSLPSGCYASMFKGCTSLTSAPELPATSFESPWANDLGCYQSMFEGCTSLTQLPTLPATTLKKRCYASMFKGCTSLTSVPSNYLSATTLAANCYMSMFANCTSLTQLPTLPATTLTDGCYIDMFNGCTSLTSVPSNYLPVTTLPQPSNNNNGCYQQMFANCTSLTSAPELPATTLTEGCYQYMFSGCTSLTQLPALPATTLAKSCYANMFSGCTSLISVPSNYLLTTTLLTESCYMGMFRNCTSLTSAPELPATTLAPLCYRDMFSNCTSLTSAPELPATTLAPQCYFQMFGGCRRLNSITMLAEDISATNCLNLWVSSVAATGTFTKAASQTSLPSGTSGIPDNWTVVDYTP